jgi:Tfp pilus assembly protein PilF
MKQGSLRSTLLALALLLTGACQSTSTKEEGTLGAELEIARQFLSIGEYKRAVISLQELRRTYPKNSTVSSMLGNAYMGIGDFDAAADAFKTSLEHNAKNQDIRLNYAYSLIVLKRYDEARANLDEIPEFGYYPYMERVHLNYGLSYLEEKRCDLAQQKFSDSLRLDPTFATAHFNRGKCYMLQKQYTQAITSFKKASDFCPTCLPPQMEAARAYYLSGKKALAVEKLERLLRMKLDKVSFNQVSKLLNEYKR